MALSAFDDKKHPPSSEDLAVMLGRSASHWRNLQEHLQKTYGPLAEEWSFSGEKFGWSLRLKEKKRNLIYLIPGQGCFLAALVFGEKAVEAIRRSDLPADWVRSVEAAKRYAEGRGVRFEVRTRKDVLAIQKLTAMKVGD